MFEKHPFTKKYVIHYIVNYENIMKEKIDDTHITLFENCDVFMYQPFNKEYENTEYDISTIKKYLKSNTIVLKINYYRFRGFWYDSEYKPYHQYNNYQFLNTKYYGIHDSFRNFNTTNKNEVIQKIDDIYISKEELMLFFNEELAKFKIIDDNSDIKMYDYFINNYQTKHLFHDPFHPTNLFFYEMFRQIVYKLDKHELNDTYDFDDIEMTHWALPILPIVKNILQLTLGDIYVFYPPKYADKKLYMNVYDYYYIRLSPENFQLYLNGII